MSILKYFDRTLVIVQDQGLPEPTSSLSNFVPHKAIESANTEVEKVKNKGPRGARSAPYLIFDSRSGFQVNELQSMASQHSSSHKFIACRKRSLCFTEYVFRDISVHFKNPTIRQIFFRQCVHAVNSPNFPAAKVSLHTIQCSYIANYFM